MEWWNTAESYLKMLRLAICQIKQKAPDDFYSLAVVNRQLIFALIIGVAENFYYTEVESVCNELKTSIAACAGYSPTPLMAEMETEVKVINADILPFLRSVNPSSYETTSVHWTTPGLMQKFTAKNNFDCLREDYFKACAACGVESVELLKCKAVSLSEACINQATILFRVAGIFNVFHC